jgi:hypothetical protein
MVARGAYFEVSGARVHPIAALKAVEHTTGEKVVLRTENCSGLSVTDEEQLLAVAAFRQGQSTAGLKNPELADTLLSLKDWRFATMDYRAPKMNAGAEFWDGLYPYLQLSRGADIAWVSRPHAQHHFPIDASMSRAEIESRADLVESMKLESMGAYVLEKLLGAAFYQFPDRTPQDATRALVALASAQPGFWEPNQPDRIDKAVAGLQLLRGAGAEVAETLSEAVRQGVTVEQAMQLIDLPVGQSSLNERARSLVSVLGSEDLMQAYAHRVSERFGTAPEELLARLLMQGTGEESSAMGETDAQVLVGGVALKKR